MKAPARKDLFRKLPPVDELLHQPEIAALIASEGRAAVTEAAREVIETLRQEIASGSLDAPGIEL
ncbi:MAG: hypothetical protein WA188_22455, partial [Terriglobales bacterium]